MRDAIRGQRTQAEAFRHIFIGHADLPVFEREATAVARRNNAPAGLWRCDREAAVPDCFAILREIEGRLRRHTVGAADGDAQPAQQHDAIKVSGEIDAAVRGTAMARVHDLGFETRQLRPWRFARGASSCGDQR